MSIINIFKYVTSLSFIIVSTSCCGEVYTCKTINGKIIYTDKYHSYCSKALLPNVMTINNNHIKPHNIKSNNKYTTNIKNGLNKLPKNHTNRYKILLNELNNEQKALNQAKKLLKSNTIQEKSIIFNEINDRRHNIYLLKQEILKIKE